ncbi:MAG: LytTR family DNA-binding domain-containing protein [Bacteroidia bacterium]|nr:LytTR family DNA-binding domain-containing protein [Bacteroidia bacterium]
MALTAIIVEDERASRETLHSYLEKYCADVEVVEMADSVKSGVIAIREHKPDLVFLDVEMPYGNAFDLLEAIGEINFQTIFVTAYSHYAIKALNYSASYYLLKPIDIEELIAAVDKVKQNIESGEHQLHTRILIDNLRTLNRQNKKVVLPILDGFEVVEVHEIIRCQANGNFTDFLLKDGSKKMICRTLKFYDELLSELGFIRIHKSHLVNMEYIVGYKKGKGGQVSMKNGDMVDVAPSRKKDLLKHF